MTNRDVALIAFRTLALWVFVSGVSLAVELLASWEQLKAGMEARTTDVSPMTLMLWGIVGAFGRSVVGILVWALAGPLSRLVFFEDGERSPETPPRMSLYRSASFLVALWLLADALPTAAYYTAWAVRTGWRPAQTDEGTAQVVELVAKLLLGVALLRGDWLIRAVQRDEEDVADKEDEGGV